MSHMVLEIIQKRLSIREEEKKLYGEVCTPIELICQGFDYLPKDVCLLHKSENIDFLKKLISVHYQNIFASKVMAW